MSLNTTRSVGTKFFSANYEVEKAGPLDARLITPLHAELYDPTAMTFRYPGMIVTVFDDPDPSLNGVWFNSNPSQLTGTGEAIGDWIKLGDGQGTGTGGGNPVAKVEYDLSTENLIVTLTHDGNGNEADWQADGAAIDISAATAKTKSTGQITLEGVDLVSSFDQKYIEYNGGGDYTLVTATLDGSDTVLTFLGNATFDETTDTAIQTYVNNGADPIVHITNIPAGGVYSPIEYGMDSSTAVVPVGGFEASGNHTAGSLDGTPFTEMWNTLLFPAVPPTPGSIGSDLFLNGTTPQTGSTDGNVYYIGDEVPANLITTATKSNWSSGEEYTPGVDYVVIEKRNSAASGWDELANFAVGGGVNVPDYDDSMHTVLATTVANATSDANPNYWRSTTYFLPGTEVGSDNLGNDSGSPFTPDATGYPNKVGIFGTLPILKNNTSDAWVELPIQKMSQSTVDWTAGFAEGVNGNPYHKLAVPIDILTIHGDDVNPGSSFTWFDDNYGDFVSFATPNWRESNSTITYTVNGVAYEYRVFIHDVSNQGGDLKYKLSM